MKDLIDRVSVVLKKVEAGYSLLLVEDKRGRLIMWSGGGRRGRQGVTAKVKRLRVLLDKDLDFGAYWESWISKAHSLLRVQQEVGSSRWGMNPFNCGQAYTGII